MAGNSTPATVHAGIVMSVNDSGTTALVCMPGPGPNDESQMWTITVYWHRAGYVTDAMLRGVTVHLQDVVMEQLGKDAWDLLGGIIVMMILAEVVPVVTGAIGALIG